MSAPPSGGTSCRVTRNSPNFLVVDVTLLIRTALNRKFRLLSGAFPAPFLQPRPAVSSSRSAPSALINSLPTSAPAIDAVRECLDAAQSRRSGRSTTTRASAGRARGDSRKSARCRRTMSSSGIEGENPRASSAHMRRKIQVAARCGREEAGSELRLFISADSIRTSMTVYLAPDSSSRKNSKDAVENSLEHSACRSKSQALLVLFRICFKNQLSINGQKRKGKLHRFSGAQ